MSDTLVARLTGALDAIPLVDPHSHIDPHAPASTTLADLLGYHYYTELAHSAGLPQATIEEPGLGPKEKVGRLVEKLDALDNTVQLSWLIEVSRDLFGFEADRITPDSWEQLYDDAERAMAADDWEQTVLDHGKLEAVFLTNEFDDPLEGFDTAKYVPCLRTDGLVFHLTDPAVRERLEKATDTAVSDAASLKAALGKLFEHFVAKNAKACAISIPPDFTPEPVLDGEADAVIARVFGPEPPDADDRVALSKFVFWSLAELCAEHGLPFDLMIGVNRSVYPGGVFQGQDLYDSRCSLSQYAALFNAFPGVTFPVSVLAPTLNQELVSYAWIFPNVITSGHWWYSNIPPHIENDLRARLAAVPQTKQIGYYSDMYKLEFGPPKFAMYRRCLAKVLAADFVVDRGWTEERAVALGKTLLRDNVTSIFKL